ncbi:MAG: shikimate dehydrogenase [Armatimonadetes bacterium]|nr:shikimate dehydrogenase [Armatimonadota bacterium]
MEDVVRFEPRAANKREALVSKVLEWTPAYEVSHITGIRSTLGATADGWFIGCPYFPNQFVTLTREAVYGKIIAACRIAEEQGAGIVGLGAFTSVVGDAGQTVSKNVGIAVTTGSSYTIATAIEGALEASRRMGSSPEDSHVAVIGATGSIGSTCAKMLSRMVGGLTLVAPNLSRLRRVAEAVLQYSKRVVSVTRDIKEALSRADIVISASSSTGGIIKASYLKPGSVVCDVALPHDVCREVAEIRPDVLVIEGGLVSVPGKVSFDFDFGYPPGIALACMSETMILALEKRYENYSMGRGIDIEKVLEISELARKHGFKLAGFRSFERPITDEEIAEKRERADSAKKKVMISYG